MIVIMVIVVIVIIMLFSVAWMKVMPRSIICRHPEVQSNDSDPGGVIMRMGNNASIMKLYTQIHCIHR